MTKDNSHTLAFASEDIPFLDRREAEAIGASLFTAHWSVLVPTLVLTIVFGILWYALTATGQSATFIGRFFIVAMAILLPLLAATAFLRFQTTRLQISGDKIAVHEGNLMGNLVEIDSGMIENVTVEPMLMGGGTISIESGQGTIAVLRNLANAEAAKKELIKNI